MYLSLIHIFRIIADAEFTFARTGICDVKVYAALKGVNLSLIHIFILTEDDRCPFLKSDGLCELILTKGEDMLC